MTKTARLNNSGFTLVELMIAIMLFSIGILGVAEMQLYSIKYNAQARRISEATIIAKDKMEELSALDYADSRLSATDGNESDDDVDDNYAVFKNITVDTPATGTKFIQVVVNWNTGGSDKNVTLETIKTEL